MPIQECVKSELDLFTSNVVQTSILKTEEVAYKPLSTLDNASVLEFVSVGHGDTYRDLSSIYLKLKIRLLKTRLGGLFTPDDKSTTGVVNNILHSLFRQCTIYLNGKPIAQSDNNYSYRAYIENLLNYGQDAASTHLETIGWALDNGDMEMPRKNDDGDADQNAGDDDGADVDKKIVDDQTSGINSGFKNRKKLFDNSVIVEVMGKIHGDFFNQPKLLMNNIDVRIAMAIEKSDFYVMSEIATDVESFIRIEDATMYMNHVTVNPNILLAHQSILQKRNAIYPYRRVECKSYTVPANNFSLSLDNIVTGQLPNLLVFGMVDNNAYTGNRGKNPFNFKHNNVSSFNLTVNGVQVPNQPIQFDYGGDCNPISTRGYNTLFKGTGIHFFDKGHQITKKFFDNGCFLLAFDLTNDLSYNNNFGSGNLLNQGVIGIECRFSKALENTITCIVYAEYDGTIEIDRHRNVIVL